MKAHFSMHSRAAFGFGLLATMVTLAGCGAAAEGDAASDDGASALDQVETRSRVESAAEFARMESFAANRVKAADVVHSFTLADGDAVDCVQRDRQPSLRGVADATIAAPPSEPPAAPEAGKDLPDSPAFLRADRVDAQGVHLSCPAGTVPIKRITASDFARFKNMEDRLQKYPSHLGGDTARDPSDHLFIDRSASSAIHPPANGPTSLHQYAHAAQSVANMGAHVAINIWSPVVQSNAEFTLGQLWVVKGAGSGLQTLEAGVQKYVDLYGNSSPHLFIYSTSNGYGNQGCYNLDCPRFVQTDNTVVIGGNLTPSVNGGAQYEVELKWYLSGGNWWLGVGSKWVGYYPGTLFNAAGLKNGAATIDFGGEIIDDRTKHAAHTTTDMGSGQYPTAGATHAAYQQNIFYWAPGGAAYYPSLTAYRDNANCYDIKLYNNGGAGGATFFYYGGPGYNTNCQ